MLSSEILHSVPAGPEMDAAVAKYVMGFSPQEIANYAVPTLREKLLSFSTRMDHAWIAVEMLRARRMQLLLASDYAWHLPPVWIAKFMPFQGPSFQAEAETAALAICRAAILASSGA